MSAVRDALPDDIYIDAIGKLWRVVGVCHEPTVIMREVENPYPMGRAERRSGGVNGAMWNGWKRIYRKDPE